MKKRRFFAPALLSLSGCLLSLSTRLLSLSAGVLLLSLSAGVLLTITESCTRFSSDTSDYRQQVSRLDSAMHHTPKYVALKRARIDSLRVVTDRAETDAEKIPAMLDYVKEWKGMSADSAIRYSNDGILLALRAGDTINVQRFYFERAMALLCSGQIYDAIEDLKHLRETGLHPRLKEEFDKTAFVVYFTLGSFYQPRERQTDYLERARNHLERLMARYDENDVTYIYYRAFLNLIDRNFELAAVDFEKVLALTPETDPRSIHTRGAYGFMLFNAGDFQNAAYNLAISAHQNTIEANLYDTSLFILGEVLSRLEGPSRASHYLNASLENSINGDMRFNLMRLNTILLKVNASLEKERSRRITTLTVMTIILAVLLAIVIRMTLNKRREVDRLTRIERRLAQANIAKDTYITEFMNLCSDYIDSLEAYNTLSKHKIATGQYEQLLAFMRSGKIIDEQREKFFDVFDKSVFQLFPDFIDSVNALLQSDKQFVTSRPDTLTTELRLVALTRLGINDVQAISRFLGISPNTIYTYRNKLRQRALNRETFDEDVKHIDMI